MAASAENISKGYTFPAHKLNLKRVGSTEKRAEPAVLVACGSFNPITYLHLRLFETARDYLAFEKNFDILGGFVSPVHDKYGKKGLLPSKHRLTMCELGTQDSDWIAVDNWEIIQEDWTRTRVVLEHFQTELEKIVGEKVKVLLVCGADLLESFAVPNLWAEEDMRIILSQFGIVALERGSKDLRTIIHEHDILADHRRNIFIAKEWVTNDVSSTKLRLQLRRGLSIKYLTPDPVVKYIQQEQLYRREDTNPVNSSNSKT